MTNQEAFNKVWQLFVVEGRTKDLNQPAVYSHKPTGCFIGCLLEPGLAQELDAVCLEEEIYSIYRILDFEGANETFDTIKELFADCDSFFLVDLQITHDNNLSQMFEEKLRGLAEKYRLEIPAFNKIELTLEFSNEN